MPQRTSRWSRDQRQAARAAGAEAHIDLLAKKYLGLDRYPHRRVDEVRVLYKIQPERVSSMG